MPRKTIVTVPGLSPPTGVMSTAVVAEAGRLLFVSGLLARDAGGAIVAAGDIRAQTRKVCENLRAAVEAAGGTLADVVRLDVYVRDIDGLADIHAVRREFFAADPPASTLVEVSRFTHPDALIEISAIAALPAAAPR